MDTSKLALIAMAAVVIAAVPLILGFGITANAIEKKEMYNFTKDGVEYVFANNVYEAMNATLEDDANIMKTLGLPASVVIAFNGSSAEDNAYFSVVSYNLVEKLKNYYVYSKGRMVGFEAADLQANQTIQQGSTIIVLKGPNTGAEKNSVYYDNVCIVNGRVISAFSRCVVVQGTDYKNLTLAADRLVLTVIGFGEKQ